MPNGLLLLVYVRIWSDGVTNDTHIHTAPFSESNANTEPKTKNPMNQLDDDDDDVDDDKNVIIKKIIENRNESVSHTTQQTKHRSEIKRTRRMSSHVHRPNESQSQVLTIFSEITSTMTMLMCLWVATSD